MVNRIITVVNSPANKRISLNTSATTLGELKQELRANNFPYEGLDFLEGISQNTLIKDESLIPANPERNGQAVMLLTTPEKKIASGAYPTNRKEFKAYIDANKLGEEINKKYGNHWTRVSTEKLISFFKKFEYSQGCTSKSTSNTEIKPASTNVTPVTATCDVKYPHNEIAQWFCTGIKAMADSHLLYIDDVKGVSSFVNSLVTDMESKSSDVTEAEIEKMLQNI